MAVTVQSTVQVQEKPAEVRVRAPVYEMVAGKPIYYRGYQKVLQGELPPEAVMGSSKLQSKIVQILVRFLLQMLDPQRFEVLSHELGFLIKPGHWRALDIAVFSRQALEAEGYTDEYVHTPPLLVIEVDTKADLSRYEGQMEWYIREKVDDLLAAGVKQVVWFTTRDRRVLDARPDQAWVLDRWTRPVPLVVEDLTLHLPTLLEEAGVALE